MIWQKPEFEEINMSAEIGSYQEDEGGRYPFSGSVPEMEASPRLENEPERDSAQA